MGWSLGWDAKLKRFRGYGVPAYCDARGCTSKIDRGLGYVAAPYGADDSWSDMDEGAVFVCSRHTYGDVYRQYLPPEHPRWLEHIQTDDSWVEWRAKNADLLKQWQEAEFS